jgi:hypothetical protein
MNSALTCFVRVPPVIQPPLIPITGAGFTIRQPSRAHIQQVNIVKRRPQYLFAKPVMRFHQIGIESGIQCISSKWLSPRPCPASVLRGGCVDTVPVVRFGTQNLRPSDLARILSLHDARHCPVDWFCTTTTGKQM